jgi:hypothetical protein
MRIQDAGFRVQWNIKNGASVFPAASILNPES